MGNCLKSHPGGLASKTPELSKGRLDKAYIKSEDEDGERSSFVEHPQQPKILVILTDQQIERFLKSNGNELTVFFLFVLQCARVAVYYIIILVYVNQSTNKL